MLTWLVSKNIGLVKATKSWNFKPKTRLLEGRIRDICIFSYLPNPTKKLSKMEEWINCICFVVVKQKKVLKSVSKETYCICCRNSELVENRKVSRKPVILTNLLETKYFKLNSSQAESSHDEIPNIFILLCWVSIGLDFPIFFKVKYLFFSFLSKKKLFFFKFRFNLDFYF